jgi:hypothetical protein
MKLITTTTLFAQNITPLEMLNNSDKIRNPSDSFYQKSLTSFVETLQMAVDK